MKNKKEITDLLESARADLEMAELGLPRANQHVPFHLQQAAEKILKAVRVHRGFVATDKHDLATLLDGNPFPGKEPLPLPPNEPWVVKLRPLAILSGYATTSRYSPKKSTETPITQQQAWLSTLKTFLAEAQSELLAP